MALSGDPRGGGWTDAAGPLSLSAGLPKGAADLVRGPVPGSPWKRVSGDSIQDRGRGRRNVGPRGHARNADPVAVSARAAHRLYLLGLRRGTRVCSGGSRPGIVFSV